MRSWFGRSLIGNSGGGTCRWAVVQLRLAAAVFVDCYVSVSLQIKTCCTMIATALVWKTTTRSNYV